MKYEARFQVVTYDGGRRRVVATRKTRGDAAEVMWPIVMAQGAANMKIEPLTVFMAA